MGVKEQRRHYTLLKQGRQSHMTPERVAELNKLGFCWDTHEATWLERLRELADFKEAHGTTAVPTNYAESPKLGTRVHHQRRQYKKFREGNRATLRQNGLKLWLDLALSGIQEMALRTTPQSQENFLLVQQKAKRAICFAGIIWMGKRNLDQQSDRDLCS